jgi:hypothetical protein
LYAITIKRNF